MFRTIINLFPTAITLILVSALFGLLAVIIFFALRYFAPTLIERNIFQIHTTFLRILVATYGVMLGFIIVILWQTYVSAQKVVSSEASELATITRMANAFNISTHTKIDNSIANYLYTLRKYEWPAMRKGKVSPESELAVTNIFFTMFSIHPQTAGEKIFYNQILNHLDQALIFRRERLFAINSILPSQLKWLMVISAFLIIAIMCFMEGPNRKSHLLMIVSVAAMVGANIGIAISLDYPFSGDIAVSYHPYTTGVLSKFMP